MLTKYFSFGGYMLNKIIVILMLAVPFYGFSMEFKVVFMVGKANVKNSQDKKWHKIQMNQLLKEDDTIQTGKNTHIILQIEKTMTIRLSESSTLNLSDLKENMDFKLRSGKLWASYYSDKKHPVTFTSPSTVVGVRGTEFIYETTEKEDQVFVIKGEIEFSQKNDKQENEQTSRVITGQVAMAKAKKGIIEVRPVTNKDIKYLFGKFPIQKFSKTPFFDLSANEYQDYYQQLIDE
jgi:hypothetical protein